MPLTTGGYLLVTLLTVATITLGDNEEIVAVSLSSWWLSQSDRVKDIVVEPYQSLAHFLTCKPCGHFSPAQEPPSAE